VTYAGFLALFVFAPLTFSVLVLRQHLRDGGYLPLLVLLGFVYAGTLPWDSAAVARGLWSFDPAKTWTARVAGLPIEELLFFGLQTLLTGLWVRRRLTRTFGMKAAA
jgi:lycopene cyclase domain-containing protein